MVERCENQPQMVSSRGNTGAEQMKSFRLSAILALLLSPVQPAMAQGIQVPVIVNGEAQIIPEFEDPETWIHHDLWVETEFDTDGDGKPDRVHVDVIRPQQTDTEGLKLPVIYESSPYFAGTSSTAREYFWNVRAWTKLPRT